MSFQLAVTPNRRAAARMVARVRQELVKALINAKAEKGLKQTDVANALGVNRSVISRQLRGREDISVGRIGELAWALGYEPHFELRKSVSAQGQNWSSPPTIVEPTIGSSSIVYISSHTVVNSTADEISEQPIWLAGAAA